MTNDELLAGFLDRSLSEDQLLEFEARREANPDFAQQAEAMIRVEKVIPMAAPVFAVPTDFLQAVEADVATKVSAGASGGFFSGAAGSAWSWIAGAGAVAITAGGVYLATQGTSTTPEPVAVVAPTQERIVPAEKQTLPVVSAPVHEAPIIQAAPARRTSIERSPSSAPVTRPSTTLTPPKAVDVQTESHDGALASLLDDLDASRSTENPVRSAQMGLAVGRTYRERGDARRAEQYLGLALADARAARTVQYEIEILGEMALNAMDAGRTYDAQEYLLKAVSVGEQAGLDVSKWKGLLDSQ